MDAVQLFVPMDRRRALQRGVRLRERVSGAVLFADISGFSPLTAALARDYGPQRGAEDLTRHLDRVVGALTAAVHRYHGSVVSFSGDGITCWFDDADCASGASVAASACALAMQHVVANLAPITTPGGEEIVVGVKVALAAGAARRLLVGASQKLEVLAGATLNRMAEAANIAARGEIVASREVIEHLDAASVESEWQQSAHGPHLVVLRRLRSSVSESPWDTVANVADELVQPWLPAAVYERLHLGQGEFLAELRPVVSMFLRFTGIDYDADEGADAKLDAYVRWVQSTVETYGGNLLQLSVDDKGCHLYLVVGALQAYADAALRAVAAACQLRTPTSDLDFVHASHIGISRGRVYAGAYGGAERCAYSVIGHEVNVAARLMERAASGEVLISDRVREEVGRSFDLEDRGEAILKGMPEPSRVFAVVGRSLPASAPVTVLDAVAPLIGRDEQKRELARDIEAVVAGRNANVVIEGPAGIGKSRLVRDFVDRARSDGVRVCVGAADAIERSTAYHVWRDVFADLLNLTSLPAPSDAARSAQMLQAQLAELNVELTHLAPLLRAVLAVALPDSPLTAEMSGKVRADNTNDLLIAILQAHAKRTPLAVVLEDSHWMDSASWALVERVRREVEPLLLILSTRSLPQPTSEEYAALLSAPATRQVRLDTLSRPAIGALLCQRLGVDAMPEPVLELIFRKSEGHPFFSEIICDTLRQAGLIQVRGRACYISPGTTLEAFDTPDTIEGVITSRIDSLGSAEQLTLKVASVIGRAFGFALLCDIHPVERDDRNLSRQVNYLAEIEMLVAGPDPNLEYLFKHVITQEVAYGLVLFRQRRELHRGIARWYEEHYGGELSPHYPRLAHHWSRAARDEQVDPEALEKALDYLERAGEQALDAYANEEAVRFFGEAIELQSLKPRAAKPGEAKQDIRPTDPRTARWRHRLSLAYQGLGDLGRCRENALQGLSLLGQPIPTGSARLLVGVLTQVARRIAGSSVRRRVSKPIEPGEKVTLKQVAELYIPLARVAYHTNDALGSLYVNTRKLNLMERLGPSPELAESYGSIGVTLGVFQLHSRADAYVRRAVDVARSAGGNRGLVTAHVISSVYLIGVGQWRRVQEHLDEGRKICEELGDHQQWGDCMAIMADAAFLEGDMVRAVGLYEELMEAARRRNNYLQELWAIRGKATTALRDGKADEAVRLLEHAVVLLEDTTDQPTRIDMHGLLAAARLGCGAWKEADRSAREAAALIAKTSPPTAYPQYLGYAAVAETFIELLRQSRQGNAVSGIADDLEKQAKQAVRNLHTYRRVFAIGRPQAWRYQGLYEELMGNRKKAQRSWEKGLASAVALGIPYEQGMLHCSLARSLPAGDPARSRHLAQAIASVEPLQSARLIEMVETQMELP